MHEATGLEAEYVQLLAEHQLEVPSYRVTRDSIERLIAKMHEIDAKEGTTARGMRGALTEAGIAAINSGFNGRLKNQVREIVRWVHASGLTLKHEVFAGEFPTGSINACVRAARGGAIILVNTGLMTFIHDFLKVMSLSVGFADFDSNGKPIISTARLNSDYCHEELDYVLTELVLGYLLHRRESIQTRIDVSSAKTSFNVRLSERCEHFVLAHEIGHIVAGHIESPKYVMTRTSVGELQTVQKEWEMEYVADKIAARLFFEAVPKVVSNQDDSWELQLALTGPLLFLQLDEFLAQVWSKLQGGSNMEPADHPPGHLRADAIWNYYRFCGVRDDYLSLATTLQEWLESRQQAVLETLDKIL